MFVSLSNFEFPIPTGLAEPGSQYWRAVELSLNSAWYLATIRSSDDEQGFRKTLLVSWDSDLVQIVQNLVGGYLEALLLMAPPFSSQGRQWRPHRIEQIWRAFDANRDDEPMLIFTTSRGKQIHGQQAESVPDSMHCHELLVTIGEIPNRK